ncbi:NUDIX hydrolase [Acidihalobacter yilgarnensis]|uniref:Phosphatase NudJ n=1 Tax=Acidihalobacter yilgarnensis TaxID=2819280 RepID=A0A1D8INR2_9GAMM|nr:NUDIX hydrolase [Acidihalobacter yilgarnensis]AOU98107.1 NUDIX hydrolase [Acidihalobacter yilgarnensis]
MRFQPHVTVAAVAEREGRFLMVRERIDERTRYNQPAGHLEAGESLLDAVARETIEETAWSFRPEALIGLYRWVSPSGSTFLRVTFAGTVGDHAPDRALDEGVEAAEWLTHDAVCALGKQLRSPLVLQSIDDYLQGRRYPLDLLRELA